MTHIARNRVMELSTSTGTGTFSVSGSIAGHRTFSAVCSVSDTFWGYIEAVDANGVPTGEWEDGLYTYSALNTITRTAVRNSSNGGAAVNFSAGNKIVGLGVFAPEDATARGEWRTLLAAAGSGANSDITSLLACTAISGLATINSGKFIPRGHIDGLTLSTAGSSATFAVAAGDATDDGQAVVMTLAASISKTTGSWAVGTGNGALDTGAIANSTWYHAWLIRRSDTGVVDVLVSLSSTAPTMPTGYDQKRLIGSMRTNGSAQWTRFVQYGDEFWWFTPALDASSSANPGTTAITETLENTPANRVTKAMVNAAARNSGTGVYVGLYLSSLTLSDDLPAETTAPLASVGWSDGSAAGNRSNANPVQVWTNSNSGGGQIRWRINGSDANVNVYIATLGWIDPRGRNA